MSLPRLPPTVPAEEVEATLRAYGACIVERLAPGKVMDAVTRDLAPYVAATPLGRDHHLGRRTRRTGSLIARSPACRDLVRHPLVLAVAGGLLSRASTYQLHLTQLITVLPGEADQPMHRDQDCDGYPFPPDYDIACNTLWALTDFTAANGATRVLPGTHLLAPDTTAEEAQEGRAVERAEMARGSVLLYTAKVWHGGGANHTGSPRQAVNLTYSVGWVRQEENQYLSTPLEVARTLDDDLLKLMGYQLGGPAIGYVRDFEDPMVVVRNRPKQALTFGHVS